MQHPFDIQPEPEDDGVNLFRAMAIGVGFGIVAWVAIIWLVLKI